MNECVNKIYGGVQWEMNTRKRIEDSKHLERYNFRVYSDNGEDGCIEEIFNRIGVTNKVFVEFGVQNGLECNSHYLLHKGWSGLWIEGDTQSYYESQLLFEAVLKRKQLLIKNQYVTCDNINGIICEVIKENEIDFLSIDIDGNDYWVWQAIDKVNPRVVCIEYNGKFPPNHEWVQAYAVNDRWDGSDWMGASLKALEVLASKKGYSLVGTDLCGINAFFVRNDLLGDKFPYSHTSENLFNAQGNTIIQYAGHQAKFCLVDTEKQEKIDELSWFFPFDRIDRGSNIMIWGCGRLGHGYYNQIVKLKYCNTIAFVDNYSDVKSYKGVSVISPEEICISDETKIVIAVMDEKERSLIEEQALKMGISKTNLIWTRYNHYFRK